jgi:ABC-type spermidine/putrescine transport system permease subunit I
MALVFLAPIVQVLYQSFMNPEFTLKGYEKVVFSTLLRKVFWNTIEISIVSSLITLLLGYPVAYHLSQQTPKLRSLFLMFVLMPFWTSILVKSYAFTILLGYDGIINTVLRWFFGPDTSVKLLFNRTGVIIGISHFLLPFMVFPILASLLLQPKDLIKAAEIMGAGRIRIFWKITFPLSLPGVFSGLLITLILSMGMFITPSLLGGGRDMMMANMIDFYTHEILNWNLASAIAVALLFLSGALILGLLRLRRGAGLFEEVK